MPDSVTEFKVEYPFPFLLMSLNKMDVFIEGIDFKINSLGNIQMDKIKNRFVPKLQTLEKVKVKEKQGQTTK
jgi:hypothetical protein